MKPKQNKNIILLLLTLFISLPLFAQSTRGLVNDGVDEYEKNNFPDAEVNFRKGIEKEIENYESHFNLGDALYKQGKFDEALEEFKNTLPLAKTNEAKAKLFHNIGNSLLKSKKLKESIGAYREALKYNPKDNETKYNLSYALKQMKNQKKNQKNNKNDNNKDDKQNKDNKDKNKDNKDKNKEDKKKEEQQKKDEQKNNKDKKNNEQKPQPKEPKDDISKQEAQRILDALKNNEAELQKKMRQKKTKKTNVEKDW